MKKNLQLKNFQGPLDLLLQLIDEQKMPITQVAIADVTEQFLAYLNNINERDPQELADFLVIATKLLLIKCHALLPFLVIEEEEDPKELETQLKMYKVYADAALQIETMIAKKNFLYERKFTSPLIEKGFFPPQRLTTNDLLTGFKDILSWLEPVVKLPKAAIKKVITLREKFCQIQALLEQKIKSHFHELVSNQHDRAEVVITFLALLELIKQQSVCARQIKPFAPITIEKL